MLPSLDGLKCFCEAARLLNFRAASKAVRLTPAALGQRNMQPRASFPARRGCSISREPGGVTSCDAGVLRGCRFGWRSRSRCRHGDLMILLAVTRGKKKGNELKKKGIGFFKADLRKMDQIEEAMSGVDHVIHCGGLSSPWGKRKDFLDINFKAFWACFN